MNSFSKMRYLAGITQLDAVEKLNVTQGAISQWEQGDCFTRAEILPQIAKLYNCTVDELLQDKPESA